MYVYVLIWSQDFILGGFFHSFIYLFLFHLHSSETKIECLEIILWKRSNQESSQARKIWLTKLFSMWIEYGSFMAVCYVLCTAVHCYWMCSAHELRKQHQTAKEVNTEEEKKHTRNMILWMFFENLFVFFFSSSSKIDFESFKVQWNA